MVPNIRNVSFENVQFGAARDNVGGGRTVGVYTPSKSKYTLKIKNCLSVDGIQGDARKWLELTVPDASAIREIDTLVVKQAQTSNLEWFGKAGLEDSVVKAMFKPSHVHNRVTVHVPVDPITNEFAGTIFNSQSKRVDPHTHPIANVRIDVVVQLTGVYFVPGQFGLSWKLIQVLVHPRYSLPTCAFQADDDDSDAEPV
jgi:hypothetical protein